jgi:acetyltransferase-like isoleucine patch superfamily enzyme
MNLRRTLKLLAVGAGTILASPAILIVRLESLWGGERIFVACSQLLSLIPGMVGAYVRSAFYFSTLEKCSWEIHVGFGSIFTHRGVALARNVSMGSYCVLGHVDIGEGVMMASRISIPSGKRQHFDEQGRVTSDARFDTVRIGPACWIGEAAVIMADVGRGCIVSAGSVVVQAMPDGCIVGGNPAKVLKQLDVANVGAQRA